MTEQWEAVTPSGVSIVARAEWGGRVIYAIRCDANQQVMSTLAHGFSVPAAMVRDWGLTMTPIELVKMPEGASE